MARSFNEADTESIWALEDLMRIGTRIQEFAADQFSDPGVINNFRSRLSREIHKFEEEQNLTIL